MGARESTSQHGQQNPAEDTEVVDYYHILEVSEDATPEEIKRSFRRLALIHHPDKNHTNVEEATLKFSAIQQAYEVLSDEQERAWYDSHRMSLAPVPDAETVFEEIRKGSNLAPRARDRGLTTGHLTPFFDASIWTDYEDIGEKSFFSVYRNLFSRLAAEESLYDLRVDYPSFGSSSWTWSIPGSVESARNFYNTWMGFSTAKDFSWMDKWNLSEAPERRIRRLMEKDNKKARDDARREYNETVKSLVKFIRKRDPRYKKHLQSQTNDVSLSKPNQSARAERQKVAEAYVEQEWQKVDTSHLHADVDWAVAEGDDLEEWECVACRKTFRSEAAWNSHERSKKHIKEVERLQREMEQDQEELDLDHPLESLPAENANELDHLSKPTPQPEPPRSDTLDSSHSPTPEPVPEPEVTAGRKKKMARQKKTQDLSSPESPPLRGASTEVYKEVQSAHVANTTVPPELSKREKRRARQAKKAEAQSSVEGTHRCNVCGETFSSRTKLFGHITDERHAQANPQQEARPQKGKNKK